MHNVNYEINATGKSRDLVDFFLFLWGREYPERGEDTFLLKIPIPTLPHGGGGGGVRQSTEHCQSFFIKANSKLVTKLQATRD